MSWVVVSADKDGHKQYLQRRTKGPRTKGFYVYDWTSAIKNAKVFHNINAAQEWLDDCETVGAQIMDTLLTGRRTAEAKLITPET